MYKDQNTKTWFFRAYLGFDENGKKIQKTRRGFKTQKEAKIAYDRFMVTHAFNRPLTEMISNNNKMTFEEFYKTRFVKWYEKQVKSQTYENAQYIFEKKLKYFYHIPLKDITMQDIEDWMFELSKTITKNARVVDSNRTLSNSYINRIIDNYICNTIKFCNLWHILNFRFEDIEIRIRNKIFEKIKEISFWNSSTEIEIISIINKMTENMDDVEKIQKYRAYLKKFMNTQHINHRIKDRFFNCAFLLEIISKEKSPFFDKRQTLTFDYTQETFKILINIIKEQSETWKFYNFSFLLEHTSVGLLTKIIEDQSLKINGETRYPDDFLKITIIQRIIINIDLDEKDIPECLIKKTNELIDWDYNLYGKEMNDYVKKHNIDIEQKFIDGIGPVTGGWVKTHPFIPVSPLTNLSQVDVLVDLLNKCPDWETQVSNDNFLNERSKQGQNEEIIRVLNPITNWEENKQFNEIFLEKVINQPILYTNLTPSIAKMLETGIENNYISTKTADSFLEKMNFKDITNISYEQEKIIKVLTKNNKSTNDTVFCVLFEDIKPNLLSTESIFLNKEKTDFVELDDFINTDLGRYYSIVEKIDEDVCKFYSKSIKEGINSLKNPYKEYLIGRNVYHIEFNIETPTRNMFIGFCHRYNLRKDEKMDFFEEIAISLLEDNAFSDEFCQNNILIMLIYKINPQDTRESVKYFV
ncbi:Arm DNA-binding domain-containing protein [Enterococcus faecium]|nr:Arm DNA-binding domain-containing protein [Enterococcus faecium]